ncbi:hypothetical protein Bca52824_011376 [Brassica carinata]|uniref:Uncharacterized protein n=1 Tax=Brassica carinata TaxID=52824 RepID=A0A8X7WHZ5_BRACI|nr:hypothetical protein Bca52824_011376 [Brassica carinata]
MAINTTRSASIDAKSQSVHTKLLTEMLNMLDSMHEELKELSDYAYDKIGKHEFSIDNIGERLQIITDAAAKMNERWTEGMMPKETSLLHGSR